MNRLNRLNQIQFKREGPEREVSRDPREIRSKRISNRKHPEAENSRNLGLDEQLSREGPLRKDADTDTDGSVLTIISYTLQNELC